VETPNIDRFTSDRIEYMWQKAADLVSIEYGILVELGFEKAYDSGRHVIRRIFFRVQDKEFEGLQVLKRYLGNIVFW
jgi:hypothetical protein